MVTRLNRNPSFPDLPMSDFLYGHKGPWPQPSLDHPFGQAPGIYNIPAAEWTDWDTYVGSYYRDKFAVFGMEAGARSLVNAFDNLQGYPVMDDAEFTTLLCEGLYSKFLAPLDARDKRTFEAYITEPDKWEYWKSDYSCMRVVRKLWAGEAVAASIALVRRPRGGPEFAYEPVALMLQVHNPATGKFVDSEIFTPADGEAWRIGRYFVLQGAIHRINLIDHTEVHFPPDTINAITKSVLPKRNLVLRLLQPHLWLSLCVNNTVLEGQRSLINRDTWYPWSPFVAKGSEVRRLLPFGWYGSTYYSAKASSDEPYADPYFDEPDGAYPPYRYTSTPPTIPSRYGKFLNSYFEPVLKFVSGVVEHMSDTDWREIGYWAEHISEWLPGFPDREDLLGADGKTRNPKRLAEALAYFIWNASVRHSADHQTLHAMIDGGVANGKTVKPSPVPFLLRVKPPLTRGYTFEPVPVDPKELNWGEREEQALAKWLLNKPLCWPLDTISAYWADLLFYMPHNSRTLTGVGVDLKGDPNLNYHFKEDALKDLVAQFHAELEALEKDLKLNHPDMYFVPLDQIASGIQY